MIVKSSFIKGLHLDSKHELLNARSSLMVLELFKALDWNSCKKLDDIQFQSFMNVSTDLKNSEIYKIFDLLDLDGSGSVEFDEFYLLICILTAIKDGQGKSFLFQNWKTCFEVLDADASGKVSMKEFQTLGFLFNFSSSAIKKIYQEFHTAGTAELDTSDFQLFVLAAVELQSKLDKTRETELGNKEGGSSSWRSKLKYALSDMGSNMKREKIWNKFALILAKWIKKKTFISDRDADLFDANLDLEDQTDSYHVGEDSLSNNQSQTFFDHKSFSSSNGTSTADRDKIGPRSSSLSSHSEPLGVPTIERTFHRVSRKKVDLYKRRAVQLVLEEEEEFLACDPDSDMIIESTISASSHDHSPTETSYEEIYDMYLTPEKDERLIWVRRLRGDGLDNLNFSSSDEDE